MVMAFDPNTNKSGNELNKSGHYHNRSRARSGHQTKCEDCYLAKEWCSQCASMVVAQLASTDLEGTRAMCNEIFNRYLKLNLI